MGHGMKRRPRPKAKMPPRRFLYQTRSMLAVFARKPGRAEIERIARRLRDWAELPG